MGQPAQPFTDTRTKTMTPETAHIYRELDKNWTDRGAFIVWFSKKVMPIGRMQCARRLTELRKAGLAEEQTRKGIVYIRKVNPPPTSQQEEAKQP